MLGHRALSSVCLLACIAVGNPAAADPAEAKRLFEQGKDAMSVGRFAEAREHFQRSLELVPKASPAFNLAVALRGMGKPKEAAEVLGRLLSDEFGALPKDRRAQVEALKREAERDIATLRVAARGAPRIDVRVDGTQVGRILAGKPLTLQVNPGERVITFSAPQREPVERRVTVAAGKSASVEAGLSLSRQARRATLTVLAKDPQHRLEIVGVARGRGKLERKLDPGRYVLILEAPQGTRRTEVTLEPATQHRVELEPIRSTLLDSPWFWAGAGAVLVGATVGGYFLLRPGDAEPITDPEFGLVEALRRR